MSPFGKKLRAKAKGELRRRAVIIGEVVRILDCGRSSKFEYEASCRHGLRAGLCLQGEAWSAADKFAGEVVMEALRRIGARRPTWQEGQPEWAQDGYAPIERYYCERCGNPIPGDKETLNAHAVKYCSTFCRDNARSERKRLYGYQVSRAQWEAQWIARREEARAERGRPCDHCGKLFNPTESKQASGHTKRFCSRACYEAALGPRPCEVCGKPFVPARIASARICSPACQTRKRRANVPGKLRVCEWCGNEFRTHKPRARFCSKGCATRMRHASARANGFACEPVAAE